MASLLKLLRFSLILLLLSGLTFFLSSVFKNAAGLHSAFQADFFQYWTAGRIFLMGLNPYDPDIVLKFQQIHWFGVGMIEPVMLWYPPYALSLILPFSLLQFEIAAALWFVINLLVFMAVIRKLSVICCSNNSFSKLFLLLSFSAPVLYNLIDGQISFILLFGLAGFLILRSSNSARNNTAADFYSGIFLSITFLKPHLLFLLYLIIFIELLSKKRVLVIPGIFTGVIALSVLPLIFNYNIFPYYISAIASPPIEFKTPTIGSWLQGLTENHTVWLRMLPSFMAIGILLLYLRRIRRIPENLIYLILPFSLLFSPYGWNNDQVLIFPLFLLIFGIIGSEIRSFTVLLLTLQVLSLALMRFSQEYHVFYPLTVLIICFYLRRKFDFRTD